MFAYTKQMLYLFINEMKIFIKCATKFNLFTIELLSYNNGQSIFIWFLKSNYSVEDGNYVYSPILSINNIPFMLRYDLYRIL